MNYKHLFTIALASLALTSCFESSTSSAGGGNLGTGAFDFEYSKTRPVKINQAAGYYIEGFASCKGATPDTNWDDTMQYKIGLRQIFRPQHQSLRALLLKTPRQAFIRVP